ncbi:MAG: RhuM family protein [Candidatus Gracilibacteria bacterium]|nr:RhuM family protein [Candidatus Gracilibacteria bacterium]MDQ7023915.1 RhuM family protein [Candidatus Gracilibacteria bacterium]
MQKNNLLIYQQNNGKISVDILVENETFWLTQTQMGEIFGKDRSTISKHIINIYDEGELFEENTIVQKAHNGSVKPTNYYNIDVILAVGYRVKSKQGTQFRVWATERLKEYLTQGFSLNEEKIKSGKDTQYFDKLQNKLRQIRISERLFYQKIKDIYTTSIDYDPKNDETIVFFKTIQNKLLCGISQKTAAELVYKRIYISKPLLGMESFSKKSEKEIIKKDVITAKNYLDEKEMKTLGLLVEQYLAFAETMAESKVIMKMSDWIERLDLILQMNGKEILTDYGKISHKLALEKSEIIYNEFKENNNKIERKETIFELERDIKLMK